MLFFSPLAYKTFLQEVKRSKVPLSLFQTNISNHHTITSPTTHSSTHSVYQKKIKQFIRNNVQVNCEAIGKTSQDASDGWFQSFFFVSKCCMLHGQSLRWTVKYSFNEELIQWSTHSMKNSFNEILFEWSTHSVKYSFREVLIQWSNQKMKYSFSEKLVQLSSRLRE